MRVAPTGNGRRESFANLPMPRMTTRSCSRQPGAGGNHRIGQVGPVRRNFGGGQVDITSGKFVFRPPKHG
jgi:TldD protein